jgi:hypothetical protein
LADNSEDWSAIMNLFNLLGHAELLVQFGMIPLASDPLASNLRKQQLRLTPEYAPPRLNFGRCRASAAIYCSDYADLLWYSAFAEITIASFCTLPLSQHRGTMIRHTLRYHFTAVAKPAVRPARRHRPPYH